MHLLCQITKNEASINGAFLGFSSLLFFFYDLILSHVSCIYLRCLFCSSCFFYSQFHAVKPTETNTILMAVSPGLEKTEETSAKRLAGTTTTLSLYFQEPHLDPGEPSTVYDTTTKHAYRLKTAQQE